MIKLNIVTTEYSKKVTQLSISEQVREEMEQKAVESAKMATLGEMAGGIAHEINGPLTIIAGNANLLQKRVAAGQFTADDTARYTKKITSTVGRLELIVKSLKSFIRVSTTDSMQKVPIKRILERSLVLCEEKLAFAQIELEIDDIPDDIYINCHETEISQVVLNLVDNAHDAIINLDKKIISIKHLLTEESVQLSFVDSGAKIPSSIADNLFKPFFTTKNVGKGTGLGLSISKTIMEKHKGTIEFDTESPSTKIMITLPRTTA